MAFLSLPGWLAVQSDPACSIRPTKPNSATRPGLLQAPDPYSFVEKREFMGMIQFTLAVSQYGALAWVKIKINKHKTSVTPPYGNKHVGIPDCAAKGLPRTRTNPTPQGFTGGIPDERLHAKISADSSELRA